MSGSPPGASPPYRYNRHLIPSVEASAVSDRPPSVVAAEVIGLHNDNDQRTPSNQHKGSSDSLSRVSHDPPAANMSHNPNHNSGPTSTLDTHQSNEASFLPGDNDRMETGNVDVPEEHKEPPILPTEPQQQPPEPLPGRSKKRLYAIISIAAVLLVGVTIAGICGAGSCGSSGGGSSNSEDNKIGESNPFPSPQVPSGDSPTVTSPSVTTPPVAAATQPPMTKLEQLTAAGEVSCGVLDLPGQSEVSSNGERVGFSVDLVCYCLGKSRLTQLLFQCRAIAAALFGTSEGTLNIVPVQTTNRFQLLNDGTVDVLAASVTHTMERDLQEPSTGVGYTFSTPYFYNGMAFAGIPEFADCANNLNTTCDGMRVCVVDGTTYVSRVTDLLPGVSVNVVPSMAAFYENFRLGFCNILAGDQFEISQSSVQKGRFFGEYKIGDNLHTKEPLALATTEDDPTWSDFCNWIVQGLLAAEEQSFTQARAGLFKTELAFGESFELMFQHAIGEVGHYGEMYDRHLASILPRTDANTINDGTSGLIYGMPFGVPSSAGPSPVAGSTLHEISEQGFLRCGITRRAIFAEFDSAAQQWTGLDVDFCKALSAAIFDGVTSTIRYEVLPATDRFLALAEGKVDVLSRITTVTLARDVNEPDARVGFSFSQPNFYDGLSFGGIPPFGACADNLDTVSGECANLRICYNSGTTFEQILLELFPERFLVSRQSGDLVAEGLETGACEAVAGGVVDVSVSNIETIGGYTGDYETGSGRFSKDPLALVTRQDDPQWSAFVYWIVSAIFYAEEEGITMATSSQMPIVNLFGPLNTRIFRDAVEAVGSYAEIYERNVGDEVERGGLNTLNTNLLTAQHYPLPGL